MMMRGGHLGVVETLPVEWHPICFFRKNRMEPPCVEATEILNGKDLGNIMPKILPKREELFKFSLDSGFSLPICSLIQRKALFLLIYPAIEKMDSLALKRVVYKTHSISKNQCSRC